MSRRRERPIAAKAMMPEAAASLMMASFVSDASVTLKIVSMRSSEVMDINTIATSLKMIVVFILSIIAQQCELFWVVGVLMSVDLKRVVEHRLTFHGI